MMVRSMSSNTRPDTLMQDRTLQAYRFLLQRTAGPYIWVRSDRDHPEDAVTHVRFAPKADKRADVSLSPLCATCGFMQCSKGRYSITLSARTKIESGIVRPSALAVLRLITNSNFVGCST